MKKFSIYVILLAAVLAVGCRKDRYDSELLDKDPWMYDYTLPVPLQFNISNSLQTKALIDNAESLKKDIEKNEGRYIGIFGLPKNPYDQFPWGANIGYCFWNLKGRIAGTEGNYNIEFVDGDGKSVAHYYPTSSEYKYSFFAYYPTDAVSNIRLLEYSEGNEDHQNVLIADVKFDGVSDIMWANSIAGKAGENSEYDGYNARYIRNDGKKPDLTFDHLLTAIEFKIKYEAPTSGTSQPIKITKFVFNDVATRGTFYLADRLTIRNNAKQGYFISSPENEGTIEVPSLYPDLDITKPDPNIDIDLTNGAVFCNAMMYAGQYYKGASGNYIHPQATQKKTYSVTINYEVGSTPNTLNINLNNDSSFIPGNKYSVTIVVKGSEQLSFTIQLNYWNNADMTSGEIVLDETKDGSDQNFTDTENGG